MIKGNAETASISFFVYMRCLETTIYVENYPIYGHGNNAIKIAPYLFCLKKFVIFAKKNPEILLEIFFRFFHPL